MARNHCVSYKTAWLIKHKLLQTMRIMYRREETRKLDVRVEVDDAYLGGECAAGTHVLSDGLCCFQAANSEARTHERIVVGGEPQSVQHAQFRWVNTMLGNLKTAFAGTHHAFDYAKYAHRYLAEFAYRFNRRYDLAAMVLRLIATAVLTQPHPRRVICVPEAGN